MIKTFVVAAFCFSLGFLHGTSQSKAKADLGFSRMEQALERIARSTEQISRCK